MNWNVHEFKVTYLAEYERKVRGGNLNSRRRKTIDRENNLVQLVNAFSDLDFLAQADINTNAVWAYKLGRASLTATIPEL